MLNIINMYSILVHKVKMLLTEPEVQKVIEQVKLTFPHFSNCSYNNEENEYYDGFSVWGEFVVNPED